MAVWWTWTALPDAGCLRAFAWVAIASKPPSSVGEGEHELALAHDLPIHQRLRVDLPRARAQLAELRLDHEDVAGHHRLAELHVVHRHEVRQLAVVLRLVQEDDPADLRHRFHDQDAGHDRPPREVAAEEIVE